MLTQIRILFVAQEKDYIIEAPPLLTYEAFLEIIETEMRKYLPPKKPEKACIRTEVEGQKYPKYIKLSK